MKLTKLQLIGMAIGIAGQILAWVLYDWKLVLVLMLVLWGNNIERRSRGL